MPQPHHGGGKRRLVLEVAVAYVAAWAVGLAFGYWLEHTSAWTGAGWERETLRWFHDHVLPGWLDRIMILTPYVGTNLTILPLIIAVGLVLWRKFNQPLVASQLLAVSIGSLSLNPTMKYLLDRPRPDLYPLRGMWTWASYPSGHLILTTALYFTVSMMLFQWKGWRWPFFASAFIVFISGYSRLYLSVHWPTDLVGGFLIGLTWLLLTWRAFARHRARTGASLGRAR